jgi:hypothetical protein
LNPSMHRTPTELCKKALQEPLENLVEEGVVTLYPGSCGMGLDSLKVHSLGQLNDSVHKMVAENLDSVWEQRKDFGNHKTTTTWDQAGILKRFYEPCGSSADEGTGGMLCDGSVRNDRMRSVPVVVASHASPGVVGGKLSGVGRRAWLLLRHTGCAPRRRVVRGCICCAPACLFFLHCCADLRFWLLVSGQRRRQATQIMLSC